MKLKQSVKIIFLISIVLVTIIFSFASRSSNNKHSLEIIKAKTAPESQVIRVIDGDTIVVALNHKPETIRLLGINTPETVKPNSPIECFGPEASNRAKELLMDKIVRLESDPSQDDRDKFHRQLRYVFLNNLNVNDTLVRDGFAREYTFKVPYKYQKQFKADQRAAKKNQIGLWGGCPKK